MTIEWAYIRKGCTSCKRALAYFEEHNISVDVTVDARKEKLEAQEAWDLIKQQNQVYIAKGKNKVVSFEPAKSEPEDVLKHAMGRTGNLRAPTVIQDKTIFIGFNEDIYTRM